MKISKQTEVSWGGTVKIGYDEGVLLRPYVPPGIKRHKSSKQTEMGSKLIEFLDLDL